MPGVGPRFVRSGRTGLARRAAVAGGVLAASAVFFAALVAVADRSTASAALTRASGRAAAVKVDATADGAGTSGDGSAGTWGNGGTGSRGGSTERASTPQPGPSAGPGGGWLPGHAMPANPTAASDIAAPRRGAAPRAPTRSNCTREVLDEGALREAVANAGPNDVICVKTGTPDATGSSSMTSTPVPTSVPARASAPTSTSVPTSTSAPTPTSVPARAVAPPRTSVPTPTSVPVPLPAGNRSGSAGRLDIDGVPNGGGPSPDGGSGGVGDAGGRSTADSRESGFPDGRFSDGSVGDGWFGDGWFGGGTEGRTGVDPRSVEPTRDCTKEVTDSAGLRQALDGAQAGDRICITGDLGSVMLEIGKGGSEQAPLAVIGNGKTAVKGIRVNANDVIVDGFQVLDGPGLGVEVTGNGVTLRHNTVRQSAGAVDGAEPDGGH